MNNEPIYFDEPTKEELDENKIRQMYQDVNMTHKKLAEIFNCSTGTIANILGKNARKEIKCKICGKKARYIKKQLCAKQIMGF